jgi:hypothetical protein
MITLIGTSCCIFFGGVGLGRNGVLGLLIVFLQPHFLS